MLDTIYNESCLDTMSRMDDNSVDMVVTSPPYNLNLRIRNGKYCSRQIVKEISTKYTGFSDNLPIDEYNRFHTQVLRELLRVSKIVFYNIQIVTGSKRSVFRMIGEFSDKLKEIIVWDKGHAEPAVGSGVLNRRSELILVFEREGAISRKFNCATFERGTIDDVWEIKRPKNRSKNCNDVYHGATFPAELVEKILVNFTKDGDVVYDPFAGTGTTLVTAKKMGRHFIGSELTENYYELAVKNIQESKLGTIDMFRP